MRLKQPIKRNQLLSRPEPIIRLVLYGTMVVVGLMTLLLLISYALVGNGYVLPRLAAAVFVMAYVTGAAVFFVKKQHGVTAWMLVVFYTAFGTIILALWGLNAPVGVLILGLTIVLAGIMLGARFILVTTIIISLIVLGVQYATTTHFLNPDTIRLGQPSTYLDALSHCTVFILFAIVAWLSGRRSEQLLRKSQRAEAALKEEKDLLSVRLEQKTREVREAQLEEMRQLYQFAELGQLGAVLLHDLANNLTALTLDIEDIGSRMQRNESITRAKESIAYLETMVNGVRRQILERDKPVVFDALRAILETIAALGPKARRAGISIEYAPGNRQPFAVRGDPIRFAHILTILLSNALEAYDEVATDSPSIVLTTSSTAKSLLIKVTDHGKGIRDTERDSLFKPFASTKPDGMGIGLFMAREMIEHHFKGSLTLDPSLSETTFIVTVPRTRSKAGISKS